MDARPVTPPPDDHRSSPDTPHDRDSIRELHPGVRTGKIRVEKALDKGEKAMENALAEKHAYEDALAGLRSAEEPDEEARGGGKRSKHPFG